MAKLLVIADDLTGALDSGVQLARKGDRVLVSLDCERGMAHAPEVDVIVIDSESRHDSAEVAYEKVSGLVYEGVRQGVARVYKKTDSGLRGNVGAELAAVVHALGADHLNFVPAYPKQQRTTRGGIHYVAGVPLAKSFFSVDPVNPVTVSDVCEVVAQQSDVAAMRWAQDAELKGIVVYDCATDDDMRNVAAYIEAHDSRAPLAGCAGLLEMLPGCSDGVHRNNPAQLSAQLVVISGSVNAVTLSQLDEAERRGAHRAHLPLEEIIANRRWGVAEAQSFGQKVLDEGSGNPVIVIDTLGMQLTSEQLADPEIPRIISRAAGLCAAVINERTDRMTMVVGGDALVRFVDEVGATLLEPIDELFPGIVLARFEGSEAAGTFITKSGAFGAVGLFHDIQRVLEERVGGVSDCR